MKLTKSELREMIRECIQEELANSSLTEGGAMSGGYAQGGSLDLYARPGGSIGGLHRTDFLAGKKTKQVPAKDLKPGMITNTGKILGVKDIGWLWGEPCVEINYGGIGRQGSHVSETPNKDKLIDVLDEELSEGAFSGGYAGDNSFSGGTVRGMGASTQPGKKSYLNRLKSNNPELVDIMTVKGKDIKPGMITQAGQVKQAEVRERGMYIMHTNNYDGFWDVDEDMEVMVDPDDKSKPFAGDYKDLLERGLKEAVNNDDSINEAATGFRLTGSALLSVEDLADAVYRDNDPDAIKKYASSKDIKDVTVEDLAIAAENSDLSREIKYLAAHLKNKGVATIGEFAATLTEALNEDVDAMDWDTLIAEADKLLDELIKESGNTEYDDGDSYWSGEEGHIWTNRYLYYTDKLNDSTMLEKLCEKYSQKLPNVTFYYTEDDFLDDPISEIGYEAVNINW